MAGSARTLVVGPGNDLWAVRADGSIHRRDGVGWTAILAHSAVSPRAQFGLTQRRSSGASARRPLSAAVVDMQLDRVVQPEKAIKVKRLVLVVVFAGASRVDRHL